MIILVFFVIALTVAITYEYIHRSKINSMAGYSLPILTNEIMQVTETDGERNWDVYWKLSGLKRGLKKNPDILKLWNDITIPLSISTTPKDALVYAKPYSKPDT